ncbi:hypothetical protein GDO86_017330 [Hymenochirus boettgeri]|uniref:MICAL-like protein 2 n=1 Tax=Hymenochirus boettgeri TaxID=247094 RepID=A0A8T2IQ42_9PIPI|nr:hypothetical protein GDO86_017330 [Hymenochirus boettgeri]
MAAIKALQQWCKQQCEGYHDVNITNMTTSFRDGLAFCAILHKHRPELIDFNSLSKQNVYENNNLAFRVAEDKLGIPALLDAEDMVKLRIPDRLSILTYVSQYYNYFHGRSPIGGLAAVKRPPSDTVEEPAGKKFTNHVPVAPQATPLGPQPAPRSNVKSNSVLENPPVRAGIREVESNSVISSICTICGKHVHLVQRHMADGKLYHRNCFKCKQCTRTLKPGDYKPGDTPGSFVCTSHHPVSPTSTVTHTATVYQPTVADKSNLKGKDQEIRTAGNTFAQIVTGSTQIKPTNETASGVSNKKNYHSTVAQGQESKPLQSTLINSPFSTNRVAQLQTNRTAVGFVNTNKNNSTSTSTSTGQQSKTSSNNLSSNQKSVLEQTSKPTAAYLLYNKVKSDSPKLTESKKDPLPSSTGKWTTPSTINETKEMSTSPKSWEVSAAKNKAAREKFFQSNTVVTEPTNKILQRDGPTSVSPSGSARSWGTPSSSGTLGVTTSSSVVSEYNGLGRTVLTTESRDEKDKARNFLLKTLGGPTSSKPSSEAGNPSVVYRTHKMTNEQISGPSVSNTKGDSPRPVPMERKLQNTTPKSTSTSQTPASTPTYPISKGASTPSAGSLSAGTEQKVEDMPSKSTTPNSSISRSENPENWRQNLKPVAKTSQTHRVVNPKVPSLPKDQESASKTTLTTINISVTTNQNLPGKENKPAEQLTPSTTQSNIDNGSSSPMPPRKKLLPVNLDLINDWPKPVQKWQDVPTKDDSKKKHHPFTQPNAPTSLANKKLRPEYIPEEEIEKQLNIIEQDLDYLEHRGVELEKQLRISDGDESEDALMVEWFKLIHEKQLLLRQESELNYISKQQTLEDQQSNVETELRNLMKKPDHLKSQTDKEREQELMNQYLLIVNDRSEIIECLDEDRIREKEEDEALEAMIRKHSENQHKEPSPEPNLKRRSRFSFSGLFKPKDKSNT